MDKKKQVHLRRALKTRRKIKELKQIRLCVHRTPRHIYAQIISADGAKTLTSASTLDKSLRAQISNGGNTAAARIIGQEVAKRAQEQGITEVAFDRSGFRYHGRVKQLAEAAREQGLRF